MKRGVLLNRHLSALVAELGHLDEVVVADAGLPHPRGVPIIDLAVTAGVPDLQQVLTALGSELIVEHAILTTEASTIVTGKITDLLTVWPANHGAAVGQSVLPHAEFKARTSQAKAIIRTGETTPFANVILVCGVAF